MEVHLAGKEVGFESQDSNKENLIKKELERIKPFLREQELVRVRQYLNFFKNSLDNRNFKIFISVIKKIPPNKLLQVLIKFNNLYLFNNKEFNDVLRGCLKEDDPSFYILKYEELNDGKYINRSKELLSQVKRNIREFLDSLYEYYGVNKSNCERYPCELLKDLERTYEFMFSDNLLNNKHYLVIMNSLFSSISSKMGYLISIKKKSILLFSLFKVAEIYSEINEKNLVSVMKNFSQISVYLGSRFSFSKGDKVFLTHYHLTQNLGQGSLIYLFNDSLHEFSHVFYNEVVFGKTNPYGKETYNINLNAGEFVVSMVTDGHYLPLNKSDPLLLSFDVHERFFKGRRDIFQSFSNPELEEIYLVEYPDNILYNIMKSYLEDKDMKRHFLDIYSLLPYGDFASFLRENSNPERERLYELVKNKRNIGDVEKIMREEYERTKGIRELLLYRGVKSMRKILEFMERKRIINKNEREEIESIYLQFLKTYLKGGENALRSIKRIHKQLNRKLLEILRREGRKRKYPSGYFDYVDIGVYNYPYNPKHLS